VLKKPDAGREAVGVVVCESPIVQMTRDTAGVITWTDQAIVELLGWAPEQLVGSPSTNLIHPADQPGAVAAWMDMITSPGSTGIWRGRYKTAAGSWKWVETENRCTDGDDAEVVTVIKAVGPNEVSLEEQFLAREQLLTQLSDALPVGVFQVDLDGRITLTNHSLHLIVGIPPKDSLKAQFATVVDSDRETLHAALSIAFGGRSVDGAELRLRVPHGEPLPVAMQDRVCLLSLRPLTDISGEISGAVGCLSDVTDRARLHKELEIRASIDELTSCFNRAATIELVDQMINGRHDEVGRAVIFVDLDGLKAVNDQFGHAAGDRLIVAAAERIRTALRSRDYVGRLGGDEFLVICPKVLGSTRAMDIAQRISSALTALVDIGRDAVELRASVGVVWTKEALDSDTLIARADDAMYESKRLGDHGVTLFAESDQVGSSNDADAVCPRDG
jgi:diguanylate cyclase (GGDEF)-like protein/PAS domain S-box-containing protein